MMPPGGSRTQTPCVLTTNHRSGLSWGGSGYPSRSGLCDRLWNLALGRSRHATWPRPPGSVVNPSMAPQPSVMTKR